MRSKLASGLSIVMLLALALFFANPSQPELMHTAGFAYQISEAQPKVGFKQIGLPSSDPLERLDSTQKEKPAPLAAKRIELESPDQSVQWHMNITQKSAGVGSGGTSSKVSEDVKVAIEDHPIKEITFEDVKSGDLGTLRIDELEPETVDDVEFEQVYAIDPEAVEFKKAKVKAIATGNALYKCKDWDFDARVCRGEWKRLKGITPGQEYEFELTRDDPGFGEIIEITNAQHLDERREFITNIYKEVSVRDDIWSETIEDGEYVRVHFETNLTNGKDITIFARTISGSPKIEIFEVGDNELIAQFTEIKDNSYDQVFLSELNGFQDTFDLRITEGSIQFDHILDPSPPTYVAGTEAVVNGGTSLVINVPAGVMDNDLLVAIVANAESEDNTYTPPSGWTTVVGETQVGQTPPSIPGAEVYYRVASSEPASYTWTASFSSGLVGHMLAFRNVGNLSGNPISTVATAASASTGCPVAPSVTTARANQTVVYVGFTDDDEVPAVEANFYPAGTTGRQATETATGGNGMGMGTATENILTASATGTRTFQNCEASEEWGAITFAILPVLNSPPSPPTNVTCDGGSCDGAFAESVDLMCLGSVDPDGDTVTYVVEASLTGLNLADDGTDVTVGGGFIENIYTSPGGTTYVVPAGASSVQITAWGAGGGGGAGGSHATNGVGGDGGGAGFAGATITTTPGETLYVHVGGGGSGGTVQGTTTAGGSGGGGGGRSEVNRTTGPIVIAAGGGGGGGGDNSNGGGSAPGGDGAPGGGLSGSVGTTSGTAGGGGGATSTAGGAAGTGGATSGSAGSARTGGEGGDEAASTTGGENNGGTSNGGDGGLGSSAAYGGGGGGGAGFFGGGGGASSTAGEGGAGGGGSGSSFTFGTSNTTTAGSGTTPGNTGDETYGGSAGVGGTGDGPCTDGSCAGNAGNDGRVVIRFLPTEANGTYSTYTDVDGEFITINNISITVEVDTYNPSGSVQAANSDPDLNLEVWNGSEWINLGDFGLPSTYTGSGLDTTDNNFTIVATQSDIITAWLNTSNQDLRIKGTHIDAFNTSLSDEINYTGIYVAVTGLKWVQLGNHTEGNNFTLNLSQFDSVTGIDLRCFAIDENGTGEQSSFLNANTSINFSATFQEPPTTPTDITCDGGSCNNTFSNAIELMCSGSTDPNGDPIQYNIYAADVQEPKIGTWTDTAGTFDIGNNLDTFQKIPFNNQVSADSIYTQASTDTDITVSETGHYLVLYSIHATTDYNNRMGWESRVAVNGNGIPHSYGSGYTRSTANDDVIFEGGAIVEITDTSQNISIETAYRTNNGDQVATIVAGNTALQIIRLDDSWDYFIANKSSNQDINSKTVWQNITWQEEVEEDAAFTHPFNSDDAQIEIGEDGHYLILSSYGVTTSNRVTFLNRIHINDNPLPNAYGYAYHRNSNGHQEANPWLMSIFNASAGDVLKVQALQEYEGTALTANTNEYASGIAIVKLPGTANFYRSYANADRNPSVGTGYALVDTIDVEVEEDAAFSGSTTGEIDIQSGYEGDFLFVFSGLANRTGQSGTRSIPHLTWFVNDADAGLGGIGWYSRGTQGGADTFFGGGSGAFILEDSGADQIELRGQELGDGGADEDALKFNRYGVMAVRLSDLFVNRTFIGNHTEGLNFSWDISGITPGTTYEQLICSAIDPTGSNTSSGEYTQVVNITIDVSDVVAPSVTNILPVAGAQRNHSIGLPFNATVTDNIAVTSVIANITLPNGTILQKTLTNLVGSTYGVIFTNTSLIGRYNITIIASDGTNVNDTQTSFFDITTLKALDIIDRNRIPVPSTVTINANQSGLLNITVTPQNHNILSMFVVNYNESGSSLNELFIENVTSDPDGEFILPTFAIDPSSLDFQYMNVTILAQGEFLYKCTNFSFENRTCINVGDDDEGYTTIENTMIPGQTYTFTINATDPGFAQGAAALDVEMAALGRETLVIAYVDNTDDDVSFEIRHTNGSTLVGPIDVDTTLAATPRGRLSVSAINSSQFVVGWSDDGDALTTAKFSIYDDDGTLLVGPTSVDTDLEQNNGNDRVDISIAQLGDRFVYCYANDDDNDADFQIFDNNGGSLVGESNADGGIAPNQFAHNLIECTAINSTRWEYLWYDDAGGGGDDVTFEVFDETGSSIISNTDVDTAAGTDAQVATTALGNDSFAMAWFDDPEDDITISVRQVDNTVLLSPTDIDTDAGTGDPRVAMATIDIPGESTEGFVVAWVDLASSDIKAAVYNKTGSEVTAPFTVTSQQSTSFVLIDALGKDSRTGNDICPTTFAVAFTNSTDQGEFLTFLHNGSVWNGECTINPYVFDLAPVSGSSIPFLTDIEIGANVTDSVQGVDRVFANVTFPNGTVQRFELSFVGQQRYNTSFTVPSLFGFYNVSFFANDTAGFINNTEFTFFVGGIDSTPPNVTNLDTNETLYGINDSVLVFAMVADDVNVEVVLANITIPNDGFETLRLSFNNVTARYEALFNTTPNLGIYNVNIIANDTVGNVNNSEFTTFRVVQPNLSIIKTDDPDPVEVGQLLTYTINYTAEQVPGVVPLTFSNFVNITSDGFEHFSPQMLETQSGTLVITFHGDNVGNDNIWVMRSTDLGMTWSTPVEVTDETEDDVFPNIFEDDNGQLIISYGHETTPGFFDIWVINSSDDGVSWGEPFVVTNSPTVSENEGVIEQYTDGTYHVLFEAVNNTLSSEIWIANSTDFTSNAWSNPIQLTNNTYLDVDPEILLVNDTFHIAWAPANPDFQEIWYSRVQPPFFFNQLDLNKSQITDNDIFDFETTISADADGNIFIGWVGMVNSSQAPLSQIGRTSNEIFIASSFDKGDSFSIRQITNNNFSDTYPGVVQTGSDGLYYISFLSPYNGEMEVFFAQRDFSPQDGINVTIVDTIPDEFIVQSIGQGGVQNGNLISWSFDTIYAGQSGFVSVTGIINTSTPNQTVIFNSANLTYYDSQGRLIDTLNLTINTSIQDTIPPSVTDLFPNGTQINQSLQTIVRANVTDNAIVDRVFANITFPSGTFQIFELSFNGATGYYDFLFNDTSNLGRYNYTIIANDTTGLINNTISDFFIVSNDPPSAPTNITCNGGSCNATFNTTIELMCSGSVDPNNDTITYHIEALYQPLIGDRTVLNADFEVDENGFVYVDDLYGTSSPGQADGARELNGNCTTDNCLNVNLNINSPTTGSSISGGWNRSITIIDEPQFVTIAFNFTLLLDDETEVGESISIRYRNVSDGSEISGPTRAGVAGTDGNPEILTGSQMYSVVLTNGTYNFDVGCFLTSVDSANENGECFIDNVVIMEINTSEPGLEWREIGTHNETGSLIWDIFDEAPQSGVDFRCRAIDNGSFTFSPYFELGANATTIDDVKPPLWFNNNTNPESPATYIKDQNYTFNITWTDNGIFDEIVFEHNFTGTPINVTYNVSSGDTYLLFIHDLPAGSYYWKSFANDTSGNRNQTFVFPFQVVRGVSTVNLTLNGTDGNFTVASGVPINLSGILITPPQGIVEIYREGSLVVNATSPASVLETFTTPGAYNITARFPGDENYTSSNETHFVIVLDETPPSVINMTPPAGAIFNISQNITIGANVTDNGAVDYVEFNITYPNGSTFVFPLSPTGDIYNVSFTIPPLVGQYNVSFFANDTSSNINDTETTFFIAQDVFPPNVTLEFPLNGTVTTDININFTCSVTDVGNLKNVTFYWNHSGSWVADGSVEVNGTFANVTFAKTDVTSDQIIWNCLAFDDQGNSDWGDDNYSLHTNASLYWTPNTPLILGTTTQNASDIPGVNNVTATGLHATTIVLCESGDCTEIISNWSISSTQDEIFQVFFSCLTDQVGAFSANYSIFSTIDDKKDFLNVSCVILNDERPNVFALIPNAGSSFPVLTNITIQANATDDVNISLVKINITYPNASTFMFDLTNAIGDIWNITFPIPSLEGRYNITFIANDTLNQKNITETTYFFGTINTPPAVSPPFLNATTPFNNTYDNLTLHYNVSDVDGDAVKNITVWYVNNNSMSVLQLPFDGGTTSTLARDYSPYSNNGTLLNGTLFNSTGGRDGFGSVQFDGVDDFIRVEDDDSLDFDNQFTIAGWFYYNGDIGSGRLIAKEDASTFSYRLVNLDDGIFGFDDALLIQLSATGTTNDLAVQVDNALTGMADQWVFHAVTYNGSTLTLYINDTIAGTSDGAITLFNDDAPLGLGSSGVGTFPFNGSMDDILLLNRSLSQEQVIALYNERTDLIVSQETSLGETWYACVTPNDGTVDGVEECSNNVTIVDIFPPNVVDLIPVAGTLVNTSQQVEIAANITDDVEVDFTSVNITFPNGTVVTLPINFTSGNKYNTTFLTPVLYGEYNVTFFANDTSGNVNNTESTTFIVFEGIPPNVTNRAPPNASLDANGEVNFRYNVTDNNGLAFCSLVIDNVTTATNTSVVQDTEESFLVTGLSNGTILWYVVCEDVSGNNATSETWTLDIIIPAGLVNTTLFINETIQDAVGNTVPATIELVDIGSEEPDVITVSGGDQENFSAGIYDIHIMPENRSVTDIYFYNITVNTNITDILDLDNFSKQVFENGVAVDPNLTGAQEVNITIEAVTGDVFRCVDYNFATRSCTGERWEKILNIQNDSNYTITLGDDVIAFAESNATINLLDQGLFLINNTQNVQIAGGAIVRVDIFPTAGNFVNFTILGHNITNIDNDIIADDFDNDTGWDINYILDPSPLNFDNATFFRVANGTSVWKCTNFNFTEEICNINMTLVTPITIGNEYVVFFNATDPVFIEQPDDVDGKDSFVRRGSAGTNFGTSNQIRVNGNLGNPGAHGLLEFNISTLPPGIRIDDAYVELYFYNSNNANNITIGVHRVTSNWTELNTTWDSRDGINNWATGGGDFDARSYDNKSFVQDYRSERWNITELVRAWENGTYPNYGMLFIAEPEGTGSNKRFRSSDYGANASQHPLLNISYTDIQPPNVTLLFPPTGSFNDTANPANLTFQCRAEDNINLTNVSLYITNNMNTSFAASQNITTTGVNVTANFSVSLPIGNYTWNCLAFDTQGLSAFAPANFTFQVNTTPIVGIIITNVSDSVTDTTATIDWLTDVAGNSTVLYGLAPLNLNESEDALPFVINHTILLTGLTPNTTYFYNVTSCNLVGLCNNSGIYNFTTVETPEVVAGAVGDRVELSISPDIVELEETALINADIRLGEEAALLANISSVTITIKRIENGSETTIINQSAMTFLQPGIWFYEFDVLLNRTGTYVAIGEAVTATIPSKTLYDSKTFFVHSRGDFVVQGVSPDLINVNQTRRLAAEVTKDGEPIEASRIENPMLRVTKVNGSTDVYNTTTGLNVGDGIIFVDGSFNETGVYLLNWSLAFQGFNKSAKEIVAVVDWDDRLSNITIGGNITGLILQNRQFLIDLLQDMEENRRFSEEEIFLVTDSIQTMDKIVSMLEGGEISEDEAQARFNAIQRRLENALGGKITGLQSLTPSLSLTKDVKSITNAFLWMILIIGALLIVASVYFPRGTFREHMPPMHFRLPKIQLPRPRRSRQRQVYSREEQYDSYRPKRRYQVILENLFGWRRSYQHYQDHQQYHPHRRRSHHTKQFRPRRPSKFQKWRTQQQRRKHHEQFYRQKTQFDHFKERGQKYIQEKKTKFRNHQMQRDERRRQRELSGAREDKTTETPRRRIDVIMDQFKSKRIGHMVGKVKDIFTEKPPKQVTKTEEWTKVPNKDVKEDIELLKELGIKVSNEKVEKITTRDEDNTPIEEEFFLELKRNRPKIKESDRILQELKETYEKQLATDPNSVTLKDINLAFIAELTRLEKEKSKQKDETPLKDKRDILRRIKETYKDE